MNADPKLIPAAGSIPAGSIDFAMSPQAFRAKHFEKAHLLLRGALRTQFSWSDVDEILHRVEPLPPYFQLFGNGEVPPEEFVDEFRDGGATRPRLSKARFYERLRNGATAVINRTELLSARARRLCSEVSRFAGQPAIGNAYLSLNGNGTFGKHWDTHDVFVLQLLGRKRWQVFAPTWRLPLVDQKSKDLGEQALGPPLLDCELEQGDVLYLPRGWWHQAIPLQGGSFHLSVGTYAPTVLDFVHWACQRQLSVFAGARMGLHGGPQSLDVDGIVAELARALRDPQALAAFHQSRQGERSSVSEFDMQSLIGGSFEDDATVQLTGSHAPNMNGATLSLNGSELRLEPLRRSLVLQLVDTPVLSVRELCRRAAPASPDAVRAALFDLAQHDVVSVHRSD